MHRPRGVRQSVIVSCSASAYNARMAILENNIFKTALFFEGGSMRAAYTCAVAAYLLEKGIFFDNVYGVSAGSSNLVNYVSRDANRVIQSFTDFADCSNIGNVKTFIQGKGLWNAQHIYMEMGRPDGDLPFDFETFKANPAKSTIVAFDRDNGQDRFFREYEMATLDDLMIRVRASSTLPIAMPAPCIDGRYYYDGGFATGGGLPLKRIEEDGFEKVFVVRTRPRGFRRDEPHAVKHGGAEGVEPPEGDCALVDERHVGVDVLFNGLGCGDFLAHGRPVGVVAAFLGLDLVPLLRETV